MTKVLIITNTKDITCDYVIRQLKHNKIEFYRFNTNFIGKSVHLHFDIVNDHYTIYDSILNITLDVKSFSAVYYRRPELPPSDESLTNNERTYVNNEIIYTLEGLYNVLEDARWISPLSAIRKAENKIFQLRLARKIGFIIPQSIISNSSKEINRFKHYWRECIIKPVKSGLIHYTTGEKVFFTSLYTEENITDNMLAAPAFLQTLIHKEVDLRVTVVGNKVFATAIHSQENSDSVVDWRKGENIPKHTQFKLPSNIAHKCVKLVKLLNLKFGAIDLVKDKNGNYIFLEINPNGQWAWIENQVGYNISGEIVKLLTKNSNKMPKHKNILLNTWRNTRDCIWPIIDKIQQPSIEINCNIDNISNGKDRYEMLRKLYDEEFSRLHTVESKSTLFMGLFSVLSTILIRYILNDGGIKDTLLIKILFFWMIIQLIRCLCLAIKVLKREQYKTIGEKEICQPDSDEGRYYKEMCSNLIDAISFNKITINKKVNYMTLLHLTFRNAMFAFLILTVIILFHEEITFIWNYFRT